jgi:FkbM family methyltransferase
LIHLLDIGARGELHPRWKRLADRLHVTAFDADQTALIQQPEVEKFDIVEGALGDTDGEVDFNLTRSPGCSSFFAPNTEFVRRFENPERFDVIERRAVRVRTLDVLGLKPHFLKLDTQGSELSILRGAEKSLHSILGIEIETEFAPLYEGAPLFPEVDTFMRAHDFELFDLNRFYWRDLEDRHLRLVSAEALYFKRRDRVEEKAIAEELIACYAISPRQAVAHAYQWAARLVRKRRLYDSDMQLGQE